MGEASAGPTSTGGAPLSVSSMGLSNSTAASGLAGTSAALSAAGTIMKGEGTQAADDMQADQLEQAAAFGETQAKLTDTTMRQNLTTTLGNIEAVRAAAGADPNSPTSVALMDQSTTRSDTQRMAAVGSIRTQDETDKSSADYLRQAGDFAVTQSYLGAAAGVVGAVGKAFTMGA